MKQIKPSDITSIASDVLCTATKCLIEDNEKFTVKCVLEMVAIACADIVKVIE